MRPRSITNHVLGIGCIAASLTAIFLWIPSDTSTGLVETVRRQVSVGDALAPTVAAGFVLAGGALVHHRDGTASAKTRVTPGNLRFLVVLLSILAVSHAVMRWAGPAAAGLVTEEGYRALRNTIPWKHIGFFLGGSLLVTGLISSVEGRVTVRSILIGALATLAMIAVYDLPFEDLLLPPNGDV
ncbi:MAG: hypothetical protein OXF07_01365 [Rhodobacter sp.]|nr:hypothetical protein [Rhodobacter sp.]MCY4167623.1 hypothetical protein [Rhodobacter sp.]MCY4243599.1 hypothetical protein [Rhodobacter sp.]